MKHASGMTLLEVVVALAAAGIVGAAGVALLANASRFGGALVDQGQGRGLIDELAKRTRDVWKTRMVPSAAGEPAPFAFTAAGAFQPGVGCNDLIIRYRSTKSPSGIASTRFQTVCAATVFPAGPRPIPVPGVLCPNNQYVVNQIDYNWPTENAPVQQKRYPAATDAVNSIAFCARQNLTELFISVGSVSGSGAKSIHHADTLFLTTNDLPAGVQLLPPP